MHPTAAAVSRVLDLPRGPLAFVRSFDRSFISPKRLLSLSPFPDDRRNPLFPFQTRLLQLGVLVCLAVWAAPLSEATLLGVSEEEQLSVGRQRPSF